MTKQEVIDLLKMNYNTLVPYLKRKYGEPQYDYFRTSECKSKNPKVSRTQEGLFCHHIDENKYPNLSHPSIAQQSPFESQRAQRLVYCNYLEHIILHIKILENYLIDKQTNCGVGLTMYMIPEVNSFYDTGSFTVKWMDAVAKTLKDDLDNYILILRYLWCLVDLKVDDSPLVKLRKVSIIPSVYTLCLTKEGHLCPKIYQHFEKYEPLNCLFVTRKDFIKIKWFKRFASQFHIESSNLFFVDKSNFKAFASTQTLKPGKEIPFKLFKKLAINKTKKSLETLEKQIKLHPSHFKFYKYTLLKLTKENRSFDKMKFRISDFRFLGCYPHEYYPTKTPPIETFFESF